MTVTASILGLGAHVPAEIVPNGPIAERLGVDEEWIVKRTGILRRRRAAPHERMSDLATAAARKALADAGVEPEEVDLVLVASMSQDEIAPNAAPLVAHGLGARSAGAVDVGAACAGWLSALQLGAGQVEAGRARRVLVIGAEAMTRLIDDDDRRTAALFGDGAGAVVLGPGGPGEIGAIELACDGGLADAIVARHSDRKLRMDGHDTFQNAVNLLSESTLKAVERAGLSLRDIDLFVYHQANGRILRAIRSRLGLAPATIADYIGDYGNTSAASIPLALSRLREDGRLRPGQRLLFAAIGAGFNWGAGVVRWGLA
jgi:3-oxoacyl-[acyl-carrier-protein] synthase III